MNFGVCECMSHFIALGQYASFTSSNLIHKPLCSHSASAFCFRVLLPHSSGRTLSDGSSYRPRILPGLLALCIVISYALLPRDAQALSMAIPEIVSTKDGFEHSVYAFEGTCSFACGVVRRRPR